MSVLPSSARRVLAVGAGALLVFGGAAWAAPPVDSAFFVYGPTQCAGGGFVNEEPAVLTRTGFEATADQDHDVAAGETVTVSPGLRPGSTAVARDNLMVLSFGDESVTLQPEDFSIGSGPDVFVPPGSAASFTVPVGAAGTVLSARLDRWEGRFTNPTGDFAFRCATDPGDGVVGLYVNRPPVAAADEASTDAITPVAVDVLANDDASWDSGTIESSFPSDEELAAQDDLREVPPEFRHAALAIVAEPEHGMATITAEGLIEYTPYEDFTGVDTVGYALTDNDGARDVAALTVTVEAPVVATIEIETSSDEVDEGESVELTVTGFNALGREIGEVTDEVDFVSDVATGVVGSVVVEVIPGAEPGVPVDPGEPVDEEPVGVEGPVAAGPDARGPVASGGPLPEAGGADRAWWAIGVGLVVAGGLGVTFGRLGRADPSRPR